MSEEKRQGRPKNALDNLKLTLSAPKLNDNDERRPQMKFSVVNNNPRIDVWTNTKDDEGNGSIQAAMDALVWTAVMIELRNAINSTEPCKATFSNSGKGGSIVSTTEVGRDDTGKIYLMVAAKDRPRIKFYFTSPYYHSLISKNGEKPEPAYESTLFAQGWMELMMQLVPCVLDTHYSEWKPDPNKARSGGGNKNWGNKKGGGGGNWNGKKNWGNKGGGGGWKGGGGGKKNWNNDSDGGNGGGNSGGDDEGWGDDIPF